MCLECFNVSRLHFLDEFQWQRLPRVWRRAAQHWETAKMRSQMQRAYSIAVIQSHIDAVWVTVRSWHLSPTTAAVQHDNAQATNCISAVRRDLTINRQTVCQSLQKIHT